MKKLALKRWDQYIQQKSNYLKKKINLISQSPKHTEYEKLRDIQLRKQKKSQRMTKNACLIARMSKSSKNIALKNSIIDNIQQKNLNEIENDSVANVIQCIQQLNNILKEYMVNEYSIDRMRPELRKLLETIMILLTNGYNNTTFFTTIINSCVMKACNHDTNQYSYLLNKLMESNNNYIDNNNVSQKTVTESLDLQNNLLIGRTKMNIIRQAFNGQLRQESDCVDLYKLFRTQDESIHKFTLKVKHEKKKITKKKKVSASALFKTFYIYAANECIAVSHNLNSIINNGEFRELIHWKERGIIPCAKAADMCNYGYGESVSVQAKLKHHSKYNSVITMLTENKFKDDNSNLLKIYQATGKYQLYYSIFKSKPAIFILYLFGKYGIVLASCAQVSIDLSWVNFFNNQKLQKYNETKLLPVKYELKENTKMIKADMKSMKSDKIYFESGMSKARKVTREYYAEYNEMQKTHQDIDYILKHPIYS